MIHKTIEINDGHLVASINRGNIWFFFHPSGKEVEIEMKTSLKGRQYVWASQWIHPTTRERIKKFLTVLIKPV